MKILETDACIYLKSFYFCLILRYKSADMRMNIVFRIFVEYKNSETL